MARAFSLRINSNVRGVVRSFRCADVGLDVSGSLSVFAELKLIANRHQRGSDARVARLRENRAFGARNEDACRSRAPAGSIRYIESEGLSCLVVFISRERRQTKAGGCERARDSRGSVDR